MTTSISLISFLTASFIALADDTISLSSSEMGSPNQNKSFLYRKTKHDHKNRSERSNASIVARKRLSQSSDTSDAESSKVETDSLPECDLVDYHWKGSRKPLILNSFVMVWKNLLDRDFVTWDERTEQSICKDVWILVSIWFVARKSSRKGRNKAYRNIYQTKNSRYYFFCLLWNPIKTLWMIRKTAPWIGSIPGGFFSLENWRTNCPLPASLPWVREGVVRGRNTNACEEPRKIRWSTVFPHFFALGLGTLILPIVRGSVYTEPHILLIRCYWPALESYVLSLPAGLHWFVLFDL